MIQFEIPGPPVPKERPRKAKDGHFYTPKRTREYEEYVGWCALEAGIALNADSDYSLEADFYLSTRRFDVDNAWKAISDGLAKSQVDWDDKQITRLLLRQFAVRDGGQERVVVRIREAIRRESADKQDM